ncbi:MAG: dihydrolipoyl dehydrogenase [Planctomycetes bacterium]|nr:dihydrolipoyl dehydrogenase [Planctomycetota bacterium]MCP4838826.1 dihydrolipoyl dehydrogenase [Planctomycetota bacterium]
MLVFRRQRGLHSPYSVLIHALEFAVASENHFDLVIIGGGPGGYVGAIRAAQLGLKTAVVERNKLGGVCLNWGCIPSKALLHNAELWSEAVTHGSEWGINFKDATLDWSTVIERSRGVTTKLNKGVGFLMKKNGVTHIEGHARITSGRSGGSPCSIDILKADGDYYHGSGEGVTDQITADRIMIATGAAPRELPFAPFDHERILSSQDAMVLPERPERLIIVGSGAIGMEFAYFYNAMGTSVTVIEMLDRILPVEDEEVSKEALKLFKKQGIDFKPGHVTTGIERTGDGVSVTIAAANDETKTETLHGDAVLVAIGVTGRYDGLFGDGVTVDIDRGHIKVASQEVEQPTYETSLSGIYAIGDIIGPPWLAHVASEEAVTCVERIAGHRTLGVDYQSIPGCTYTSPQIASIGMTEAAAREAGHDVQIGKFPLTALGKAIATGAAEGFVKIVASEPYGEILGAHIIGKDASELIHEFCLAIRLEATAEDVISTMHAHPTMAESLHEAALAIESRSLHS